MSGNVAGYGTLGSRYRRLMSSSNNSMISVMIALFALIAVLSITSPNFLSTKNILSVLQQVSYIAIMAAGMSFLIISGNIDLSVAATLAITAAFTGEMYVNRGMSALLAITLAIVIGCACGAISSFFITRFNLAPIIVTLAFMEIYRGAASVFTGGFTALGMPEFVRWIGQGKLFDMIPVCVVLMLAIYGISWFILSKTRFGLNLYAMGGNIGAAKLSGINTGRVRMMAFIINGLFASIAGIVLSGRMNSSSSSLADGIEMDCIAAAVIGGVSMAGGEGVVWGGLFGALLMGVLKNGMNQLSINSFWQKIILGFVLLIAIVIDAMRGASRKKR